MTPAILPSRARYTADPMSAPRRVLMVTLRYPPAMGAGAIQTLKHQKYLPLHGWIGDTLTGPADGDPAPLAFEPALEGPGETLRLRFPDPLRVADHLQARQHGRAARTLRRLARYGAAPDGQVLFAPVALVRARGVLDRYDVLYASGMPWSGLLAAAALKLRSNRPLVLGLRDPWVEPDGVRYGRTRNRVEALLERAALAAADAVVVTAEGLRLDLLRRHPRLAGRVHVIPNGYDEEDFQQPPAAPLGPFDLVHTGNFYGTKGPTDLFEGVRRWLQAHPERRAGLHVRLVGPERPADREAAARHGLEDVVVFEGPMPHAEAVARLLAARAVTAIDYGPEQAATRVLSKSFEYMRSGRPILFLSSGGDTEKILAPCPRARIVPKADPAAVAAALEAIARAPEAPREFTPDPYTLRFARPVLAGRFAEVLGEVSA
jgi:glycosyltransferase involved in cell wall biosynthesis